jgi:hypothetical protein
MKIKELSVAVVTDGVATVVYGKSKLRAIIYLTYDGSIEGTPGSKEHEDLRRKEVTRLKRILEKALADAP